MTRLCLGIESTAHTFGASVVSFDGEVLSNERQLYTTEEGGLVPVKLAEHHVAHCDVVVKNALEKAGVSMKDIDLISFSQSPGIGHSLRIGALTARTLAVEHAIPLVGVNHCVAHLEIGRLLAKNPDDLSERCDDPILLYASGANTQVIGYEGGRYRVFGETLDVGVGNFLDSFARVLGLGFPGGPQIEQLARKGSEFMLLPYSVKGMDVSFGGLQTKCEQLFACGVLSKEDVCFSAQETVFAMLVEVAERALAHTGKRQLVLGGGVACNVRLQEMARLMCQGRGASCFLLENQFNVDNAAMIAWTGVLFATGGTSSGAIVHQLAVEDASIFPYIRTDEVAVTWRD